MSWLSAISGADASNAAGKTQKANAKVQGTYGRLLQGAESDYNALHSLFGGDNAFAGFTAAMNNLNRNPQQQIDQQAAGNNERAQQQSNQLATFFRSQGYGDGLAGGAAAGAYQNAATQTNAYAAQQNSPEAAMQRFLAYLQTQQGVEGNALSALNTFGQGAIGQVPQQQGSPLAGIASLLPLFLSGGSSAAASPFQLLK